MQTYKVEYTSNGMRDLSKLPREVQSRAVGAIVKLAVEPRPHGCVKLTGAEGPWRVRIGQHRVVYAIDDAVGVVTITRVRHRRDVYRS